MKLFNLTVFLCATLLSANAYGQNTQLETYKLGEGLNFSHENGTKIRFTGYLQPYMDSKQYTDLDDNSTQNRFRLRRARFRLDGN